MEDMDTTDFLMERAAATSIRKTSLTRKQDGGSVSAVC